MLAIEGNPQLAGERDVAIPGTESPRGFWSLISSDQASEKPLMHRLGLGVSRQSPLNSVLKVGHASFVFW
jgi:hypothetical protein